MDKYQSEKEIRQRAADEHITAEELNLLISKARELTNRREHELQELRRLLEELEARLRTPEE